jgi:hypothetical protein
VCIQSALQNSSEFFVGFFQRSVDRNFPSLLLSVLEFKHDGVKGFRDWRFSVTRLTRVGTCSASYKNFPVLRLTPRGMKQRH